MTGKIYRGILISTVITMLACLIFTVGVQYQIYDEKSYKELRSKAEIISVAAEENSLSEYSDISDRITLIDPSGKVLYDNKSNPDAMENHSSRREVKEAEADGEGYDTRRSETLGQKTCYYAKNLKNGNILRVAGASLTVWAVVLELLPPICAIAIMVFVLANILASVISKKIVKPINEIDLDRPVTDSAYSELSPLISKINAQNRKIDRQIAKLMRSRREFEAIAENMSEGLVLTDINGNILTHNKGTEKFFGTQGDINGSNILTLNRSEVFRKIFDDIKERRSGDDVLPLDGKYFNITANPVYDENGEPCGAVILLVDITEKEKREKLRREFTANVSHELKTPLTSICGISDMLMNGIVKPEDVKGFGGDINREAARLLALVNDIIRLSELDEGAEDTEKAETTDIFEVANNVVKSISGVAKKAEITVTAEGESTLVSGGKSLIFEMIYNLCDNAVKYNRENGSVKVTVGSAGGSAFSRVSDTGIGIAPEHIDRIFERFYRVDKSRSKQSGGTGLGLSIVKHIALSLGGKISAESRPGEGTEITITLPEITDK